MYLKISNYTTAIGSLPGSASSSTIYKKVRSQCNRMTHDSTAPPLQRILREAIKRRHTRTVKPNVLRGTEKTNVTNIVRETHQKRTGCSRLPLPLSAMEHALAETVLKKIHEWHGQRLNATRGMSKAYPSNTSLKQPTTRWLQATCRTHCKPAQGNRISHGTTVPGPSNFTATKHHDQTREPSNTSWCFLPLRTVCALHDQTHERK